MKEPYKQPKDGFQVPSSVSLECQVVAELIGSPEYISTAREIIDEKVFSDERFLSLWRDLNEKDTNRDPIDIITMRSSMDNDTLQEIITSQAETGLTTLLTTREHCFALRELCVRRKVFLSALEMLERASDNRTNFSDLVLMPDKLSESISDTSSPQSRTQDITSALNELAEEIQRIKDEKTTGRAPRVPTGLPLLDYLTYGGFNKGDLVILSARPSVGKTAVALFLAKNASKAGFPVSLYSLEMTNLSLAQRLLFSTGKVTPDELASGLVSWEDLERANKEFDGLPLYLNDTARTLDDLTSSIIENNQKGKCKIAFIDYLGLLERTNQRQPLYQVIGDATRRFKLLAKQLRIPIVVLCQLNRNSVEEDRAPELFDLRDSGNIEQDADIVLMLERASRDLTDRNINLWVRKNRQGRAGEVCVKLEANSTFSSFSQGE